MAGLLSCPDPRPPMPCRLLPGGEPRGPKKLRGVCGEQRAKQDRNGQPLYVGKGRISPSFPSWLGPEARPWGCPRVWLLHQAWRQTSTGPHLLEQLPVLEEHLVPRPTGHHRAPPTPARGATLSSCSRRRPQQRRTHPFLTDGQGISDTVIFPPETPGLLTTPTPVPTGQILCDSTHMGPRGDWTSRWGQGLAWG